MSVVNLSNIVFTKAKFRYSISELVDDFLKGKTRQRGSGI